MGVVQWESSLKWVKKGLQVVTVSLNSLVVVCLRRLQLIGDLVSFFFFSYSRMFSVCFVNQLRFWFISWGICSLNRLVLRLYWSFNLLVMQYSKTCIDRMKENQCSWNKETQLKCEESTKKEKDSRTTLSNFPRKFIGKSCNRKDEEKANKLLQFLDCSFPPCSLWSYSVSSATSSNRFLYFPVSWCFVIENLMTLS